MPEFCSSGKPMQGDWQVCHFTCQRSALHPGLWLVLYTLLWSCDDANVDRARTLIFQQAMCLKAILSSVFFFFFSCPFQRELCHWLFPALELANSSKHYKKWKLNEVLYLNRTHASLLTKLCMARDYVVLWNVLGFFCHFLSNIFYFLFYFVPWIPPPPSQNPQCQDWLCMWPLQSVSGL